MKITVWGINYAPEQTGIAPCNTDLCEYLRDTGNEVRMVTGFPYYPDWKKRPADRGRLFTTETRTGVTLHRCWQYVPRHPRALTRMLHEGSFVLTSFLRLLFTPRPDLLIVVSPPLPLGPAAWLLCLLKRCPYQFHVQDMQPDAAISLGLLKEGPLTRFLYGVERFSCRRARIVSGITRGMLELFTAKGIPSEKQYLFPNWISHRQPGASEAPTRFSFRERNAIGPDEFLAVYSGNLGRKQGLDIVLDAAALLRDRPDLPRRIAFVIAGEGAAKAALEERIRRDALPVRLLPLQPAEWFEAMLREADICLVTQQSGSGALFFPSKILTLLSAGCAVVTVADEESELAKAVRDGRFGRNVLPGQPEALASTLVEMASHPKELPALGASGKEWVKRFSRESVLGGFTRHLHETLAAPIATAECMASDGK